MTQLNELPQTGYTLLQVYSNAQHLEVKQPHASGAGEGEFDLAWDWKILGDATFEVILRIELHATKQRHEEALVSICGRFQVNGQPKTVEFRSFVQTQAVAILFPFAREGLASLTARGFYGPLLLPPMNVARLLERAKFDESTGAKQMADGLPHGLLFGGDEIALGPAASPKELKAPVKRRLRKPRSK